MLILWRGKFFIKGSLTSNVIEGHIGSLLFLKINFFLNIFFKNLSKNDKQWLTFPNLPLFMIPKYSVGDRKIDRAERHDFWSQFLLIYSPFLIFSLGGKRQGEKNNQGRGKKACLSARSGKSV